MKVLLVEPDYYTKFPPLGLMKLASYHRSRGNQVKLVSGTDENSNFYPDKIEITSLFTYAWRPVHDAIEFYHKQYPGAKIRVGGIYASLMPRHIKTSFPFVDVHVGLFEKAEQYLPAYDILLDTEKWKDWDSSILFTSRGCIRRCHYCAVPKIEGKMRSVIDDVEKYIFDGHKKVIIWDNNFLASAGWKKILEKLKELGVKVDFNQGLDARLINEEKAKILAEVRIPLIRMAYDNVCDKEAVAKAVDLLSGHGVKKRNILFYVLYNFYDASQLKGDTPPMFLKRINHLAELGCVSYPMRFEPLTSLEKNQFVSPLWTTKKLEMIARARRVIGYGGAFPPYKGLVRKFATARNFYDAFSLKTPREQKNGPKLKRARWSGRSDWRNGKLHLNGRRVSNL
jgi:hypothetical protein